MPTSEEGTPTAKVGTISGKKGPELRFSDKGTPYCKFSIRVKPYVPKDQPQPEPTYYDVTCFKSLAEHVARDLQKGDRVGVFGLGRLETWTGQDGQQRSKKVIVADFVGPDLRFSGVDVHRSNSPGNPTGIDQGEPF